MIILADSLMACGILFLQKKVFDLLYKVADVPFLELHKAKILVSVQTYSSLIWRYLADKFLLFSSIGPHFLIS